LTLSDRNSPPEEGPIRIHHPEAVPDPPQGAWPEPGPLLARIDSPADLRALAVDQLPQLCQELRTYIWETVTQVGGHLAPSLGVVELTVVLHYLFDTPRDRILWDVGHQGYVHKVLTGRREALRSIRQFGGISGFLKRQESAYDVLAAGHASTAISAALGVATARDAAGENYRVVAVVGDGGMTGGLAYEGMNNAGASQRNLIVILNDNGMSISPNVGAISRYLTGIISHPFFNRLKADIWGLTEKMPKSQTLRFFVRKVEESLKTLMTPGMLFEDLGFRYLGPIDGHDVRELISVLEKSRALTGPMLIHVQTRKGKGYKIAEVDPQKYHGVKPVASGSGKIEPVRPRLAYTDVFGHGMLLLAEEKPELLAITAAMADGTGLLGYAERFPDRFFDVGIAEAHGVTFASGLAMEGMRPVVAIYSTFLQRAFDQIVHDVSIPRLPVVFCLDRAGLVGEDGPTHHGVFDLTYLGCVPGLVLAAPRNGTELLGLMRAAVSWRTGPFAIRYPREAVPEEEMPDFPEPISVGTWEVLHPIAPLTLLAVGSMVDPAVEAAAILRREGMEVGVVNCRFIRPLDPVVLSSVAEGAQRVVTLEENVLAGGFGSQVMRWFDGQSGVRAPRITSIGLPDAFVEHGSRRKLLELCGLTAGQIADRLRPPPGSVSSEPGREAATGALAWNPELKP
jgi:1-deoxy-D-xylulose-5-phosphate synthase